MADLAMTRLHEAMVVIYAISIVFYFLDYLNKDAKAHRIAFWLISIVWILQTVFLLLYIIEMQRFPILNLFEGIYFYVWLLISLSIFLHCVYRIDLPVFFLNIIGFIFLTIHTFAPSQIETSTVGEAIRSELLFIHITFAIFSYVAFSLAFVCSVLYLILYRFLKRKKFSKQWGRLPSLKQTEIGMTASVLIGIPFLLISLILGLQWAYLSLDDFSVFDVKIIGSFILLIFYCLLLYLHRRNKIVGTNYAWLHVYTFLFVVINFFLGSQLSNFHFWY